MTKRFSRYFEQLEKQDKKTRALLIVAAFGILLFLGIANTLPFKDILFHNLFRKSLSSAQVTRLIGANYAHHEVINCDVSNKAIIFSYHQPGVRDKVKSQLTTMRSNNIETLRMIIWHMTAIEHHTWGPVPSAGGSMPEPYRTNFINYLTDVKAAGFKRLTVSMGPMWTNGPLSDNYDPALFDENWRFLQDVRSLLKTYGPTDTRVDLHNEGAPSIYQGPSYDRMTAYLTQMYKNYVAAYGKDDVTVSIIAGTTGRLTNMITIFNNAGYGQPNWYEIHVYSNGSAATVLSDLQRYDSILKQNNLSQPIVIGETYYNNQEIANGIRQFINTSSRQVDEIIQWPLSHGSSCRDYSENPPYVVTAYEPLRSLSSPTPTPTRVPTPTPTRTLIDTTPPRVTITSPSNNSKVTANRNTTITARASDASGVQRVDFYVENVLKCTDTTEPYTCVWNVPNRAGRIYSLKSRAYDTKGNMAASAVVRVTSR